VETAVPGGMFSTPCTPQYTAETAGSSKRIGSERGSRNAIPRCRVGVPSFSIFEVCILRHFVSSCEPRSSRGLGRFSRHFLPPVTSRLLATRILA